MIVICYIALQLSEVHWENVVAEGKILNERENKWYVDFATYINQHPKFKEWNYEVLPVNPNSCSYKEKL
jgi:hypothetical protein